MVDIPIVPIEANSLIERISSKRFAFVAAISFEERSTAWAHFLWKQGLRPDEVILFDYNTKAVPENEDREMRNKCRKDFGVFLELKKPQESILDSVNAFAVNQLNYLSANFLDRCQRDTDIIIVDITCMTRVHLIGLSSALRTRVGKTVQIFFCYATPRSYGFQQGILLGWKDTLFVPIGKRRFFKREGYSRGIIFAGHYGERISVALQELEPACGSLIYTKQEDRPDLLRRAKEVNNFIERRLSLLRMPRVKVGDQNSDRWRVEVIGLDDFPDLYKILINEAKLAAQDEGPIMIYPFGPKPITIFSSLLLGSIQDAQAWAVYPVPDRFDARYSVGVGYLYAYSLNSLKLLQVDQ